MSNSDTVLEAARIAAKSLPLADKIIALRDDKEAKQAAYAKVTA